MLPHNHSEDMRATGGTRPELIKNVLDSSVSLDKWTVFLRETLQNSNDQRLPESPEITFGLHYEKLSDIGFSTIKAMLAKEGPHLSDEKIRIDPKISQLPILIVSDSGTRGLSGGTDARKEDDSNFCNFFYFSGQLESRTAGGGSYGIGRNVLFSASRVRTIVVYSQIIHDGKPEQRFMAMAASKGFKHEGYNYTGRHWWGEKLSNPNDGVGPIRGNSALQLAKAFGLDKHLDKGTGTVIGVIDPDMENPKDLMSGLGLTLLINAWPHLVKKGSESETLQASITYLGTKINVPDPRSEVSPVAHFVDAYLEDQARSKVFIEDFKFNGSLDHLHQWVQNDDKHLGRLTWKKYMGIKEELPDLTEKGLARGSSIALMRSAKLIVEYFPVTSPDDGSNIYGVFTAGENFEGAFRKAETATHDKWLASRLGLPSGSRNPVKQAEDAISKTFYSSKSDSGTGNEGLGTPVLLANQLGKLIAGIGVTGGYSPDSKTPTGKRGGGGGKKLKIESASKPQLLSRADGLCVGEFYFKVTGKPQVDSSHKYSPVVKVWLGDSFEKEAPAGSQEPRVTTVSTKNAGAASWTDLKVNRLEGSALSENMSIKVRVSYPSNIQITCDFPAESEAP